MAYAGSLGGGWVYEDHRADWGMDGIWAMPLSWAISRRWLTNQSYALTTAFLGPDPSMARLVSLAWHLVNGWLVWLVARRAVTASISALAAGIFLLWPIQVESVAAVAYRTELVSATFFLLALIAAERGQLVVAWLCACATVLGKEMGVVAFALVPLWCAWVGPNWTRRQGQGWAVACLVPALAGLWWAHSYSSFRIVASPSEMAISLSSVLLLVGRGLWSVFDPRVLSIAYDTRWLVPSSVIPLLGFCLPFYGFGTPWMRRACVWIAVAMSLRIVAPSPEFHDHYLYTSWIVVSLALAHLVNEGAACISTKNFPARCTSLTGAR